MLGKGVPGNLGLVYMLTILIVLTVGFTGTHIQGVITKYSECLNTKVIITVKDTSSLIPLKIPSLTLNTLIASFYLDLSQIFPFHRGGKRSKLKGNSKRRDV